MKRAITIPEIIAIIVGLALLILGIVWQLQSAKASGTPAAVKQPVIMMNPSDFNEDPALQGVIQKQLNNSTQNAPVQTPSGDSSPQTGGLLQSAMSGLQAK